MDVELKGFSFRHLWLVLNLLGWFAAIIISKADPANGTAILLSIAPLAFSIWIAIKTLAIGTNLAIAGGLALSIVIGCRYEGSKPASGNLVGSAVLLAIFDAAIYSRIMWEIVSFCYFMYVTFCAYILILGGVFIAIEKLEKYRIARAKRGLFLQKFDFFPY